MPFDVYPNHGPAKHLKVINTIILIIPLKQYRLNYHNKRNVNEASNCFNIIYNIALCKHPADRFGKSHHSVSNPDVFSKKYHDYYEILPKA